MKKKSVFLIATALSLSLATNVFGAINVNLNGKTLNLSAPAKIINGRTMVPVRGIFENLGATVTWNPERKEVVGIKDNKIILLDVGVNYASIGNLLNENDIQTIKLDSPATIIDGNVYVPARFVAESLDATVSWNEATKLITILSSEADKKQVDSFTESESGISSYLMSKYSTCDTPLGTANFTFGVLENSEDTNPFDYAIFVNYNTNLQLFSDIEHSIKYTDAQKSEAKTKLQNHMNSIALDLIKKMPSKKLMGQYLCSWYRYPNIKEGFETRTACTWKNHTGTLLSKYEEANLSSFQWDTKHDNFFVK